MPLSVRRRWRAYRNGHQPGPYAMHASDGGHRGQNNDLDRRQSPPSEYDSNRVTANYRMPWVYLVEEIPDEE